MENMDFKLRLITGIILLLIVFVPVIIMLISGKRRMKKLEKAAKLDPTLKQRVRIIKSDHPRSFKITRNDISKIIVLLLIFLTVGIFFVNKGFENDIGKARLTLGIIFALLVIFLVLTKIKHETVEKSKAATIKSVLERKYGPIEILPTPDKEFVKGNKTEEGNIRKVYLFSYRIAKYNCIVNGYYKEELITYTSNVEIFTQARNYRKIGFFLDYIYDIKDNNETVLDTLESVVSSLSRTRIMISYIKNNQLYVMKKTVFYGYNEEDANIDAEDVNIFYDELVKRIEGDR